MSTREEREAYRAKVAAIRKAAEEQAEQQAQEMARMSAQSGAWRNRLPQQQQDPNDIFRF